MSTETMTYAELIGTIDIKSIETTEGGGNGYPRRLSMAYTADTMGELRELKEAAEAAGHEVSVIHLHRRDGWALWERHNNGSKHDLADDKWMGTSDQDWTITINSACDREQEAFAAICGDRYEVEDVEDLMAKAKAVKELAEDLADPDGLENDEVVIHFLDSNNGWRINYTVQTGQNGYSHDTHQYCTALVIVERDEEEEND